MPDVKVIGVTLRDPFSRRALEVCGRAVLRADRLGMEHYGPAPAPLTKLRGEHRAQFFLKGTSRKAMREALQLAVSRKPSLAKRISIDVDPLSML